MRIIAITTPKVDNRDAQIIRRLLASGVDIVHLRKPESGIEECREVLKQLSGHEREKIIVHDFPQLYYEFSLKGIHVNRNIVALPDDYNGFRTRSCHSFEEVQQFKNEYDYLFLSPIFNSISKAGYNAGFTGEELKKASDEGIIDQKVVALGGVTFDKVPYLKKLNFGGAAMLGALYK
jgi:thiamine-phosphate pyrophosphorylase